MKIFPTETFICNPPPTTLVKKGRDSRESRPFFNTGPRVKQGRDSRESRLFFTRCFDGRIFVSFFTSNGYAIIATEWVNRLGEVIISSMNRKKDLRAFASGCVIV